MTTSTGSAVSFSVDSPHFPLRSVAIAIARVLPRLHPELCSCARPRHPLAARPCSSAAHCPSPIRALAAPSPIHRRMAACYCVLPMLAAVLAAALVAALVLLLPLGALAARVVMLPPGVAAACCCWPRPWSCAPVCVRDVSVGECVLVRCVCAYVCG